MRSLSGLVATAIIGAAPSISNGQTPEDIQMMDNKLLSECIAKNIQDETIRRVCTNIFSPAPKKLTGYQIDVQQMTRMRIERAIFNKTILEYAGGFLPIKIRLDETDGMVLSKKSQQTHEDIERAQYYWLEPAHGVTNINYKISGNFRETILKKEHLSIGVQAYIHFR